MSGHDDFADGSDATADWVAEEVDAAWDDDAGDDGAWAPDDHDVVPAIELDDDGGVGSDLDPGDDLDLDLDLDLDRDDVEVGDGDADSPSIDLPLGDDDTGVDGLLAPGGDLSPGFLDVDGVADLAGWLGADVDADQLRDALAGIGGDDEPVLDSRTTVQLLDGAGVDALVTHGTLDDLADTLDAGGRVVLAGEDGSRYEVVAVDFRTDVLLVEGEDGSRSIPLETFEDAWADGAFEMVVATGDPDAGGLTLLPLSLDPPGVT